MRLPPIKDTLWWLVPTVLPPKNILLCPYLLFMGHLGERRVYDTIYPEFCRMDMANNDAVTVRDCLSCAGSRQTNNKLRKLPFLLLFRPLQFMVMDVPGPMQKNMFGSLFIVGTTDRYLKLTKIIPTAWTITTVIASNLVYQWISNIHIATTVITDNGR